jgi:hypothetical protein
VVVAVAVAIPTPEVQLPVLVDWAAADWVVERRPALLVLLTPAAVAVAAAIPEQLEQPQQMAATVVLASY